MLFVSSCTRMMRNGIFGVWGLKNVKNCVFMSCLHLIADNLARSANLPTGLYILPSVISFFFNLRQIISGSTGPIFTIFSPNERYLREFSRSGPLFYSFRDVAMATDFGLNLQSDLHSPPWHFKMELNIAIWISS